MKNAVIRLLVVLAVAPLLLEGLLRLFDPLGAHYFTDLEILGRASVPDNARSYILGPGRYALRGWSVTELSNGVRYTPAPDPGGCLLLILGDSVAFGQGVNDDDTFGSVLAKSLPVQPINAAFEGYNSHQVLGALLHFPQAEVAVYLISNNDKDPAWRFDQPAPVGDMPAISLYATALWAMQHHGGAQEDQTRFDADMKQIAADPRVILFAFPESVGEETHAHYGSHIIPWYTHHNSYFDGHPSAAGHAEIAAAMLPIVRSAVRERCTAIL